MAANDDGAANDNPADRAFLEWQIVTVALACIMRSAMGLPTMSLRLRARRRSRLRSGFLAAQEFPCMLGRSGQADASRGVR